MIAHLNSIVSENPLQNSITISIQEIMNLIPHRYPMLLVDRLEDVVLNEKAVGIKNVTMNEHFFSGHFPHAPVMPGVMIVEAMAQTSGVLVMKTLNISHENHLVYFMSIDNVRFRKPVLPGDTLHLHVEKRQKRGLVWKFEGRALVKDTLVAEALYTAMIVPNSQREDSN